MVLRNIVSGITDFLFPSQCVICGESISYFDNCLCSSCLNDIDYITSKCDFCSGVIIDGCCTICSDKKWYISRNIALAEYSGKLKEILHYYKFHKRKRLYKHLSGLACAELMEQHISFDLLTSVPMNRTKKWRRGFNQSELIAKELAKRTGKKYRSVLIERYGSETQRTLRYNERFLNILDRYKIKNTSAIKDKRVLLIDDVFTTGATINECARILIFNGAIEVYSLTIARANVKDFNDDL